MSDENDIYLDGRAFYDLSMMWQHACTLCFANDDLYRRSIKNAHAIVRQKMLEWYEDEETKITYLLAPAENVRRRLHLQGYTDERCRELWDREFRKHIAKLEEMNSYKGIDVTQDIASQKGLNFESWLERAESLGIDHWIRNDVVEFDLNDMFASLALELHYFKPEYVWTDLQSYADEFDTELTVHQNLRRLHRFEDNLQEFVRETGTVLILTEGKSDTEVLSTAIKAMYPEFSDLFQFVDFQEFSIEGGAPMLTKLVKAFAGARMEQSILALFDNDAAGVAESRHIDRIKALPNNIKTMVLPDIELAKDYPTIGPEGRRRMNVNGAACSIELFLGKQALTDRDGDLHPIRWTGWNNQIQRYQGALEHKDDVTKRFLTRMKKGGEPASLRIEYAEMDQLLNAIFSAFH
ncbi:hypothetical protein Q669_29365 [Labrenzia sp. C1B10]|uniref:hypothetical protein n=1 Tax=unclassified Labrenzia TaxID=2648686 RepID=UPI0003B834DD|nr:MULTISPECIES: hypothetical protein [unclassified Labrenzia]ERP95684.1 hypothetical protein Q669_29365 [Labrenzia sp. C1B10]ERS05750.1 hypothetical protein Q675_28930 [Labrenzia sp. C1B70]